jgi:DNA-binding SARP family transcriptional activator/streptogramin lyase
VEFRILGPLVALDDGEELPLGPAKERAVLAALLLRAGSIVSRAELVDGLWGASPPLTAERALNVYVSQLRKTLARNGAAAIETRTPGYVLAVDSESVDATRFQRLAQAARERAAAGELEAAATLMREALALWRGPALLGVELEGEARAEIARLDELRLAAELEWVDYELALGRHEQLVPELERLVARHPLDERARGQLVLALYRSGRQADALRAYRDARQTLVNELGLEPGESLQRLEKAVLNQDPSLAAPAGTAIPESAARGSRRSLLTLVAGLAAVSAVAVVVVSTLPHGSAPSVVANSLVRLDQSGRRVEAITRIGALPQRAVALGDALWLLSPRNRTLSRVDARTDSVTTIGLPGSPRDVAAGEGAVWAATETERGAAVARIDPKTAEIESTTRVDVDPVAVAAGEGAVWLAGQNVRGRGGVLLRLSPATNNVTASIPLPSKPSAVAVGPQAVWVTAQLPGSPPNRSAGGIVYVVDPSSSRIVARSRAPFVPLHGRTSLAVGARAAWLVGADGALVSLDPRTAAVTHVTHTPIATDVVAVSGGSVWAAGDGGVIYRINARTGAVIDRSGRSRATVRPAALAAAYRHLWLTVGPTQTLRTAPLVADRRLRAAVIRVPDGPTRIRYTNGDVWVRSFAEDGLVRIDPHSNRVVATFRTDGGGDIGFGNGSVWATSFADNVVERIDPTTNAVVARIATNGSSPLGVAAAGGAIWIANHHASTAGRDRTGSVVKIDPRQNRVVTNIPLGAQENCCGPDNMIAAFGDVWVDVPNQHLLVRIDARHTRIAARIHVPDGCGQLAAGAGALWLANGCSAGLLRIDPKKNRIAAHIDTNGSPVYPLDYHDGSVWTVTDDLRLLRIDPSSNSVLSTTNLAPADRPGAAGPFIAFGSGSLWISDFDGGRVLRSAVPPQ